MADDKGTGANSNSEKKEVIPPAIDPKQLEALMKTVGTLASAVAGQGKQIEALATSLKAPEKPDHSGNENVDLESLSRSDFAKHIVETLNGQLKPIFDQLGQRIDTVHTTHGTKALKGDMDMFAKEHKDFWDLQDEIQKIAKETPGINFQRAYTIARTENPEKAKELDAKYAPPKQETPKFGGLTPTSGSSTKSNTMKPAEASQAAWEEVMTGIPLGDDTV